MRITGLKLHNFRNYASLELVPEPGINVFTGLNGVGKTNVLEAFFLCALGRSHRTGRDGELIRLGEQEGMVLVRLDTRGGTRSIRCELRSGERKKSKSGRIASAAFGRIDGLPECGHVFSGGSGAY